MTLRSVLRRQRHRLSTSFRLWWSRLDWRRLRSLPADAPAALPIRRLLLLPADAGNLVGSRGDEAMMAAVVSALRHVAPDLSIAVVVASAQAERAAAELGFTPLRLWGSPMSVGAQMRAVSHFRPDAVAVVGADVMDGYYNVLHPTRMLILADLLARSGARATVLGFSFNAQPAPALRSVFEGLSQRVRLHVRDPISLERFCAFCAADAKLVADAAFLLSPDSQDPLARELAAWADARRAAGDSVLAFNVHPMLIKGASDADVERLIASAATALQRLAD
ncbi:MAG TPA: polysaccharide pyruvyl transferase family protein, partial [Burkholderiaceae bacterium]|nr:polysaccharide pyruvyl transferase family protein [Burkholderiaceae bacterium]